MKIILFSWLVLFASLGFVLQQNRDQESYGIDKEAVAHYRSLRALSCAASPYVPDDFLKRPIELKTGIGIICFPISTQSGNTQRLFNQGMAFLYNFEWVQAARSFYTATHYDSSAAMLYWALSQAYEALDDTTASRTMAANALEHSTGITERELWYIRLQHALVQPAHDSTATADKRRLVSTLMDSANISLPNDPEMWAFTGVLRAFGGFKGPEGEHYAQSARQAIDNYLNRALQLNADHFGVCHYLIHFHEGTSEFAKALEYGERYTKAAPEIPHAWHMYAHDLMKNGRVSEAIQNFTYAFDLEAKKYESENMPAHYDWHHSHNMELLAYCYQYKGQFKAAEKIFGELDTLRAYTPERQGWIRKGHPYFYLQNNQPEKALHLVQPLIESKESSNRYLGYFIAGLAQVFQKNTTAAKSSYDAAIHIIDSLKNNDIQKGTRIADAEEQYSYMYAQAGTITMGIGLLQNPGDSAVSKQMKTIQASMLRQTGPDPWIESLYFLQMLTQMSINTGNLPLAESSARNMIKHDAGYPGSYLMLARIKKLQGDSKLANEYLLKAKAGYKDADAGFKKSLCL